MGNKPSKYEKLRIFIINNGETVVRLYPKLATEIGLNESIILLHLEYWCSLSEHIYDGKRWTYQSISDLKTTFPFWGSATINRALHSLIDNGYIYVSNYNKYKYDHTRWFSINYEKCATLKSVAIKEA